MRRGLLTAGLLLAALTSTAEVSAATVNVHFEGTLSQVGNPTFGDIFSGTTISGDFSYETRSSASPFLAVYVDALSSFSATISGVPVGPSATLVYSAPAGSITIANPSASGNDEFHLGIRASDGLTGTTLPLGQGDIIAFSLVLKDSDETVFDSADTPTSLALAPFEDATIELSNLLGNAIYTITALDGAIVPLPGAIWLFAAGLCGVFARGRVGTT